MPILLAICLLIPVVSWGYPEFIGYKYSSCLTCHFNGNGNGPLNDYGRALWSAEIAGRLLASGQSEEQLGQSAGIIGKQKLPWWIRPGVKARYLGVQTNPGGSGSTSRSILMQAEANTALFLDPNQKYAFIGSIGYAPVPRRLQGQPTEKDAKTWISREHYVRVQTTEDLWLYLGFLDKPFGIRTVDHTAFSRSQTGLAQNDQSHGFLVQYIRPTWETSLNAFLGNLQQDAGLRQKGASTTAEFEIGDAWRLGASLLFSSNDFVQNQRMALHSRSGAGHGSALLFEAGLIDDKPKAGTQTNKQGYYVFSEAIQRILRGYHVFISAQAYKERLDATRPNQLRVTAGLLAFPMGRLELRAEVENNRNISPASTVEAESWALLNQIHVSL